MSTNTLSQYVKSRFEYLACAGLANIAPERLSQQHADTVTGIARQLATARQLQPEVGTQLINAILDSPLSQTDKDSAVDSVNSKIDMCAGQPAEDQKKQVHDFFHQYVQLDHPVGNAF